MTNYKGRGAWVRIATYEAAIDEAVKTFTLPTGDNFKNTSKYVLIMDGSVDGAATIYIGFNGVGANYFTEGYSIVGGAEALIDVGTAAAAVVASSTLLAGADDVFHIEINIMLTKGASADYINGISHGAANGSLLSCNIRSVNDATELTSIELTTSANKWQAGSRFTLYKVTR